MAHDFGIRNTRTHKVAFFYGYADGIFYDAFNAWDKFNGMSGDASLTTISKKEASKGLAKALALFDNLEPSYPDTTRIDEVRNFSTSMRNDPENDTYDIYFG